MFNLKQRTLVMNALLTPKWVILFAKQYEFLSKKVDEKLCDL